jgi:hypothetical protein
MSLLLHSCGPLCEGVWGITRGKSRPGADGGESINAGKDMHLGFLTLRVIDAQLGDVRWRLHKLYDALETGRLDVEDLAYRTRELKAQMDDLEQNALT